MTSETSLTAEDNLLAYKIISLNYNASFYFWTSIGLGAAAIFSAKFFMEAGILVGGLEYVYAFILAVPAGLLFWRYVINRSDRMELSAGLVKRFGNIESSADKLKQLNTNFNKRVVSTLLRARSIVTLITVFEAVLLTYRLSTDTTFTELNVVYAFILLGGLLATGILTGITKLIYRRDMKIFSQEIPATEEPVAATNEPNKE